MKCELGTICSRLSSGKNLPAKFVYQQGKYPVYGGNGLRGYTDTYNFKGECAIIGRQGAFCGNVRYFQGTGYMTEHAVVACANENNNNRYLAYLLSTMHLGRLSAQSAQPGLSVKTLSKQIVDVPSLESQNKIASILSVLDDKIELNNKINENLQRQTQALFRSWFIDFMPFDGIKPDNWFKYSLGDVPQMSAGGDKPKVTSVTKSDECPYPIYSNGLENEGLYGYTNRAKIFVESVTVSARGTIGFVCLRHFPYVPIVRLVTLVPDEAFLSAKYLYLYLKQLNITGTGTTQQQLTVPDFRKTGILVRDKTTMGEFTGLVAPLFGKIWANENENVQLSSLRDAILPKLMSGEIDVTNIPI